MFETLGRYDEAVEVHLQARNLAGDGPDRLQALRDAYNSGGMRGYWLKRADHLTETAATDEVSPLELANIYARAGDRAQALAWVEKLTDPASNFTPIILSGIYVELGETDLAMATLEKAYEQHHFWLVYLKSDPRWEPLRDDPRFQDLVRRMNFPE